MNPRFRPLLLAFGALLSGATTASAQFIELVTEAPVTFQITITSTTTTATSQPGGASTRATSSTPAKVVQTDIIKELQNSQIIPGAPADGWRLVAVSHAPADLRHITGYFALYAVNGETRVLVPENKFAAAAHNSVAKYKEQHLGQYVLSSSGTVTNHVSFEYLPKFSTPNISFAITDSMSDGFATISYKSKDASDGYTVFFHAVSSTRIVARGSFLASASLQNPPATEDKSGLISYTVSLGAAKLVPASLYPAVPTYPGF